MLCRVLLCGELLLFLVMVLIGLRLVCSFKDRLGIIDGFRWCCIVSWWSCFLVMVVFVSSVVGSGWSWVLCGCWLCFCNRVGLVWLWICWIVVVVVVVRCVGWWSVVICFLVVLGWWWYLRLGIVVIFVSGWWIVLVIVVIWWYVCFWGESFSCLCRLWWCGRGLVGWRWICVGCWCCGVGLWKWCVGRLS